MILLEKIGISVTKSDLTLGTPNARIAPFAVCAKSISDSETVPTPVLITLMATSSSSGKSFKLFCKASTAPFESALIYTGISFLGFVGSASASVMPSLLAIFASFAALSRAKRCFLAVSLSFSLILYRKCKYTKNDVFYLQFVIDFAFSSDSTTKMSSPGSASSFNPTSVTAEEGPALLICLPFASKINRTLAKEFPTTKKSPGFKVPFLTTIFAVGPNPCCTTDSTTVASPFPVGSALLHYKNDNVVKLTSSLTLRHVT